MEIAKLIRRKSKIFMALEKVDEAAVENHPDEITPKNEVNPILDDISPMSVSSPLHKGDWAEIMARRSFIIAKAHLLYLHKKELARYASEMPKN